MFMDGKSVDETFDWLESKFGSNEQLDRHSAIRTLRLCNSKYQKRFNECHRKRSVFQQKHSSWLKYSVNFKLTTLSASQRVGRPKKGFSDGCQKTKLRKICDLRESVPVNELTQAAVSSLRAAGNRDVAWVVEYLTLHPGKATMVKNFLKSDFPSAGSGRISVDDALSFLCENDLSKQQYSNIRKMSLSKGSDIYPSYNELREGKELCYPESKYIIIIGSSDHVQS